MGRKTYEDIRDQAQEVTAKFRSLLGLGEGEQASPCLPRHLEVGLSMGRLTGVLHTLYDGDQPTLGEARYTSELKGKHLIQAWITHCFANAALGRPVRTVLVCRGKTVELQPEPQALERLEELVELFRQGRTRALPFFPNTSYAFALNLEKGLGKALGAAAAKWERQDRGGGGTYPGEGDEVYVKRCFPNAPLETREFQDLALKVFGPLLERTHG